jgi:hypothetical protein
MKPRLEPVQGFKAAPTRSIGWQGRMRLHSVDAKQVVDGDKVQKIRSLLARAYIWKGGKPHEGMPWRAVDRFKLSDLIRSNHWHGFFGGNGSDSGRGLLPRAPTSRED